MTPQEIGQWIAQHGGPAGGEGPDANGVIVNRAKDGSVLTVKRNTPNDFTEVSRQEAAPATAAPAPAASAASPAGGGTSVNEQDVLAQLATFAPGGDPSKLEYVESTEPRKVTRVPPGGIDPVEMTVSMPVRTWYDPSTGRAMKFDVGDSGTFTRTFSGVDPNLKKQGAQTGQRTNTEGTPDPSKPTGFDNDRPIMVTRGPNNQIIESRPLTAPERAQWEKDTGKAQGAKAREEVKDHPGIFHVVTKDANGNTDDHYEDASGKTVPAPADIPKSRTNPTNNHFEEFDPTTNTWVDRGPIQTKPIIRPNPVTGEDEQVQEVPDGQGGTKLVVKPIERQGGNPAVPAGAPEVDLSTPDTAYASFMRLYQWATQQVATGKQTPTWLENTLKGPHEAVTLALNRETTKKAEEQRQTSNALTQRAQDITQSGGRLSAATSGFATANDAAMKTNALAGPGINAAASTLLGTLALERINAQQMGGMVDAPPVVPGPMNSLPVYPGAAPAAPVTSNPAVGPVATGVTATNAAAINPTGANVQAANSATMQGSRAAFGNLGVGPGADLPGIRTGAAMTGAGVDDPVLSTGQADNRFAMPTMALASTFGGKPSYDPAIQKMRDLGMSEESIATAMRNHTSGVAA